jgi:hypothetical protein
MQAAHNIVYFIAVCNIGFEHGFGIGKIPLLTLFPNPFIIIMNTDYRRA